MGGFCSHEAVTDPIGPTARGGFTFVANLVTESVKLGRASFRIGFEELIQIESMSDRPAERVENFDNSDSVTRRRLSTGDQDIRVLISVSQNEGLSVHVATTSGGDDSFS